MTSKELLLTQYDSFSAAQKKVADYLLTNTRQASYLTAKELAACNGVSEPVIFRLCSKLGISGYSVLQKMLIQELVDERDGGEGGGEDRNCLDELCSSIRSDLDTKLTAYPDRRLREIAGWLHGFRKIYVMGYGEAYGLINQIYSHLSSMQQEIAFVRDSPAAPAGYVQYGPDVLLIAASFEPYFVFTQRNCELAKKMGASVLTISDSPADPAARIADHLLLVERETYGGYMDWETQWISTLTRAVHRTYIDLFPDTVRETAERNRNMKELYESSHK